MSRVRVLVVEDSLTVRRHLVEALGADPELEVVGEASDGREGIALVEALRPDVVTMDMVLPDVSGLAATEHLMAYFPTPILIVSSSLNRGELYQTYEALAAGAVDVLEKPGAGDARDGSWERRFREKVRRVARIRVIPHPRAKLRPAGALRALAADPADPADPAAPSPAPGALTSRPSAGIELVAIGASTGGPGALRTLLRGLPADFDLPILIVLHLSAPFGIAFASWLATQLSFPVACATDGARLPLPGRAQALLAPPGSHLVVRRGRLALTLDPERHSCRPSVDVLFESVARERGPAAAGVLLTGMGRDGAEGLLELRRAGGVTLAQDESTSVVYGMPGEAARLGAAARILPLTELAGALGALRTGAPPGEWARRGAPERSGEAP